MYNNHKMYEARNKALKVIKSSKTLEHFFSSINYVKLFNKMFYSENNKLFHLMSKELNEEVNIVRIKKFYKWNNCFLKREWKDDRD